MAFYPNDPYQDSSEWSTEWNQLTNAGKQNLYQLGIWLRKRYDFLSLKYKFDEIYITSSDTARTIESAEICLAGLYPPISNDIWNEELLWQPIPVHTVPAKKDSLTIGPMVFHCPNFNSLYNIETSINDEIQQNLVKHKSFFDYLSEHSGSPVNTTFGSVNHIAKIRDSLLAENLSNKR